MNTVLFDEETLERLVKEAVNKAVQKEREECIKIVEDVAWQYVSPTWAFSIVKAIREKVQK
jgi:DNA-binding protein YbaB